MKRPPELQLAQLADEVPAGDDWLHEQKFDGYRILAVRDGREVTLLSRNFKPWTDHFPTVVAAVAALPCKRVMLDGEVAAVLPDGRTSFQALHDPKAAGAALAYFAFDVLAIDGDDVAALPLEQRKARLQELVAGSDVIRYSDHVIGRGAELFAEACKRGLEGIVSKRRDQPYTPGRNSGWRKIKCGLRQELVIGGYTEPEGTRSHVGAVLVGVYEGKRLVYAGKVGTGFTRKTLAELAAAFAPLATKTCPFDPPPKVPRAHWLEPELVCEVAFFEWTSDGRLRHPSFEGLREDKPAKQVVRERAAHMSRRK